MTARRSRAALLLGLMFAAGLAVGLAGERYALHRTGSVERALDESEGRTTIERFSEQLGVTPEQRARIDPILVETRERMAELYDRHRPEWRVLIDSARSRIEAVLTPEQVEEYRALLEEQEGRRHSDRSGDVDSGDQPD
jgi:Spy/CpxP family protein refolding chaperone